MLERTELESAQAEFMARFPEYGRTRYLDALRTRDFARLDASRHVYLDYGGAGLHGESQLAEHFSLLHDQVLGNPHSANRASLTATHLVEETRAAILAHFNASPDDYTVVFTPNATGALKLVGESWPFRAGDRLLLTFDNHNSVNGIREYASRRGARVTYVPLEPGELRVDAEALDQALDRLAPGERGLFAFPAQSNFSGVQHPLEWIARARARGWTVLLDAAAFVPTSPLDLGMHRPDFVPLSFYKMFGHPTGIGCLIARKEALTVLRRPWFAGGTITFSSVQGGGHYLTPGHAGFEDGTVSYAAIPAVRVGLDYLDQVGMDMINLRVMCLTEWLLEQLPTLRHRNGAPVVKVYGPLDTHARGATVQFNVFDANGRRIDAYAVEKDAGEKNISLRAGCHCNPGAREVALGFTQEEMARCFEGTDGLDHANFLRRIQGHTTGAVRASLGLVSTFRDVYTLVELVRQYARRTARASALEEAFAHGAGARPQAPWRPVTWS